MCGVVGAWDVPGAAAAALTGLRALQHRGQQAAGIMSVDHGRVHRRAGNGLVAQVFASGNVEDLPGTVALGHVRYPTSGGDAVENSQPVVMERGGRHFALAHNGNVINAPHLRAGLQAAGAHFQGNADSEVILQLVVAHGGPLEEALVAVARRLEGAFSVVMVESGVLGPRMVALRDAHGFRPLVVGTCGTGVMVASETSALEEMGGRVERALECGELWVVDGAGVRSSVVLEKERPAACAFELVYLARPDSVVDGRRVAVAREAAGRLLAGKVQHLEADVVVGVPEGGLPAAAALAGSLGLPLVAGLTARPGQGRTFMKLTQHLREAAVRAKINAVPELVQGRRVLLVDDSLVRGTTARHAVRALREAGAVAVHLAVASPPMRAPCFYGVDTPTAAELLASSRDVAAVAVLLGVDSLTHLDHAELLQSLEDGAGTHCTACFTGTYPTPVGNVLNDT